VWPWTKAPATTHEPATPTNEPAPTEDELDALAKRLTDAIEVINRQPISDEHKDALKTNATNHLADQCRLYLQAQKNFT
jgi:hypothetical protein